MYISVCSAEMIPLVTSSALEVHGWGMQHLRPGGLHINALHACHGHRAHSKINHADINNTFSEQHWSCYFLGWWKNSTGAWKKYKCWKLSTSDNAISMPSKSDAKNYWQFLNFTCIDLVFNFKNWTWRVCKFQKETNKTNITLCTHNKYNAE